MSDGALLRLKTLQFEGAGSYKLKTPVIPLAGQGQVLIHGQEGSGKTMIPEVLTLIFHGKGSPRMRTAGLVESSIVNQATGYCGTVEFESGFGAASREVCITQAFKHKKLKSKYIITIDGEREEPDGKPQQRKLVTRLVPLSMGEWLGVVYLNQGAVHDLLAGTPTGKREYLTSVFGLDFYDDLNEVVKDELKALKSGTGSGLDLEQRKKDLESEISKLEDDTSNLISSGVGVEESRQEIEDCQDIIESCSKKIGGIDRSIKQVEKYERLVTGLEDLSDGITVGSDSTETDLLLQEEKDRADKMVSELTDLKSDLKSIETSRREYARAKKRYDSLYKIMKSLKKDRKSLQSAVENAPDLEICEGQIDLLRKALQVFDGDTVLPDPIDDGPVDWEESVQQTQALVENIKSLRKVAGKLRGGATCPTCMQEVDTEEMSKAISSLESQRDSVYSTSLERLSNAISSRYRIDNDGQMSLLAIRAWYKDHTQAYDRLKKVKKEYKSQLETYREVKEDFEAMEEPEQSDALSVKIDSLNTSIAEVKETIKRLSNVLVAQKQIDSMREDIADVDVSALDKRRKSLSKKSSEARDRIAELREYLSRVEFNQTTIKSLSSQLDKVVLKLKEHADTAVRIKTYEDDLVPYFSALRAAKVRSCVSVLEGVLPVYIGAMSTSQYVGSELKINISDDLKKVDLLLKNGKNSDWVSAVQSSGGQRRGFTLAIIAALREVSPRRANVMFFDEPFSDLQGDRKMAFVNRLVPLMMDRCEDLESVFVIAHDQEILESSKDTFNHRWEATRGDDGSRLLM